MRTRSHCAALLTQRSRSRHGEAAIPSSFNVGLVLIFWLQPLQCELLQMVTSVCIRVVEDSAAAAGWSLAYKCDTGCYFDEGQNSLSPFLWTTIPPG